MLGTRAEGIFEELKKNLSPESIWQNVLVPQHDILEGFGTPTTRLNFTIVFVPLTLNKKNSK